MVGEMSKPIDNDGPGTPTLAGELYETEIGDRDPSEAVIDVVAAIKDVRPTELAPLYRSLDPDALDALCTNGGDVPATVRFDYEGLVVTVSATNAISVYEP